MKTNVPKVIPCIIACAVIAAAAFYGGMQYGQYKDANSQSARNSFANLSSEERAARRRDAGVGATGMNAGGAGFGGLRSAGQGGFVSGEVLSTDDKSITIKLRAGGSKIVFISSDTQIMKSVSGSAADIAKGVQVTVAGSANQDGSVNAESIQIRPAPAVSAP